MPDSFSGDVQTIIGSLLSERGFTVDEIDERPLVGGRPPHVVYYRSNDCKIQIYESRRDGETNCMIAPVDAPNEFGPNSTKWHYLDRFAQPREPATPETLRAAIAEYRSYANPVEWVRDHIVKYYDDAHRGILAKYNEGYSL
ncbi:hypothetical protein EV580_6594 [Mycobacterium sp. BK086]|uniref:hypothetical protein n=1 Tax=Mycobacterium sp. BK086 TaxID=2512165 RepID=UPI001060C05F|nr:hypothetical protein [Mycobacterium sp. BK086]TDO06502.1 hypothetical protein EV580_6594 [Mycobacterium sp. BK086]